jgi:hypothetical protein
MHFFVDNATTVPQYLVCKHPTVQRVGFKKSERAPEQLNLLKEAFNSWQPRKKQPRKRRKSSRLAEPSLRAFQQGKIVMTGVHRNTLFYCLFVPLI